MMIISRLLALSAAVVMVAGAPSASAQAPSVVDSVTEARARTLVGDFLRVASREKLTKQVVDRMTAGPFHEKMKEQVDRTPFSTRLTYLIGGVQPVYGGDSALAVAVTGVGDTLPRYGPLSVEMVFFLVVDADGAYRIAELKRYSELEEGVRFVRYVDTTTAFPASLKPEIIRERTGALLSNAQLREHWERNRAGFDQLVTMFTGRDSLRILGRIDRSVIQLNRMGIDWGEAAEEIPQEAIDEYLASATPVQRVEMQQQLKVIAKMRRAGRDSLAAYAKRYRIPLHRVDTAVARMKALRTTFVNGALPWPGAVQFTVGGSLDDAVGYFYSPKDQLPLISPEEYYYLEELGDGWWIFRAT